jgi:hypothetical protein
LSVVRGLDQITANRRGLAAISDNGTQLTSNAKLGRTSRRLGLNRTR